MSQLALSKYATYLGLEYSVKTQIYPSRFFFKFQLSLISPMDLDG